MEQALCQGTNLGHQRKVRRFQRQVMVSGSLHDLPTRLFQLFLIPADQNDPGAQLAQLLSDDATQTGGGASDDRGSSFE